MKLLLLFALVLAVSAQESCPGNQVYSTCGGCITRCDERSQLKACPLICQQGCTCPPNTFLTGDDMCVSADRCPSVQEADDDVEEVVCPGNQVYSTCAGCINRCDERSGPKVCTLNCRQGCTCPPNTFLNGDMCVSADRCPRTSEVVCPGNQVYSDCAGCITTCEERSQPKVCTMQCRQECTCPPNTFLNGDMCVTADQCPSTGSAGTNCRAGMKLGSPINQNTQVDVTCNATDACSIVTATISMGGINADMEVGQCLPASDCPLVTCASIKTYLPESIRSSMTECQTDCVSSAVVHPPVVGPPPSVLIRFRKSKRKPQLKFNGFVAYLMSNSTNCECKEAGAPMCPVGKFLTSRKRIAGAPVVQAGCDQPLVMDYPAANSAKVLGEWVAPRCTDADVIMRVVVRGTDGILYQDNAELDMSQQFLTKVIKPKAKKAKKPKRPKKPKKNRRE